VPAARDDDRLGARPLVFDLFGGYVLQEGGSIGLRPLTRLLGLFGVSDDTVRVVMSRLRRQGWFTTSRQGRQVTYAPTARLVALLAEGSERIYLRAIGAWDGQWHLVIYQVPETARASRDRLRTRLAFLGYGPLAPSTWVSPHAHDRLIDAAAADEPLARVEVLAARSRGAAADREIARQCWDLEALDSQYRQWLRSWEPRLRRYARRRPEGTAALVERTRLLHGYRRFPFTDPDLPAELLPRRWAGHRAHEVFLAADAALADAATAAYRAAAGETSGAR